MNPILLNVLFGLSLFIVTVLLLWQTFERGRAEHDLFYMGQRLEKSIITCDRLYREKVEAVAIADHAIEVITEAMGLVQKQALASRLDFLVRSFVDRRQEAQNEKDLQDEINKLTGGK